MRLKIGWGSHLPVLMKMIVHTRGPVLEVGGGLFSTPYLHYACKRDGRELTTLENDPRFYKFLSKYDHDVRFVENWDDVEIDKYSFIFFDHAPAERRVVDIARWKDNADFLVVHDTELVHEKEYNYKSIYPLFKYHYKYRAEYPHTSVLSNTHDPAHIFL